MAISNSPYRDIAEIYRAGNAWQAEKDEEKRKNIQANAQQYYKNLINSGYADIANELSASDSKRRKEIMDKWAAITDTTTGTLKTGVNNPAYNNEISLASANNQKLVKQQESDRNMMTDKYGKLENYIYDHNPYESEIGKSIMDGYTWKGMKASDNEVASGAASNGGNVDSFAEANAARQQLAYTNAGKQAVLNDFNARIGNVQNTLSNLGIYLQNQDAGMQKSINMQDNRAQNIFNNEQTALNNDVARKSEIASVTGYAPDEWVVSNNPYMNDNGTIKDEYKDNDFAAIMANAKAKGNTEAYNAAATARFYKIMGDYAKYGQYDDGAYNIPGLKRTEEAREFDEQIKQADRALGAESSMNAANNQAKLSLADKEAAAALNLANVNNASAEKIAAMKAQEPTLTPAQATTALKNGELNDTILAVYNAANGTEYTMDNPPPVYKVPASDLLTSGDPEKIRDTWNYPPKPEREDSNTPEQSKNAPMPETTSEPASAPVTIPALSLELITAWVNKLNKEVSDKWGADKKAIAGTMGNYQRADVDADFIISRVLGADDLNSEQKESLLFDVFKITEDELNTALKDRHYR